MSGDGAVIQRSLPGNGQSYELQQEFPSAIDGQPKYPWVQLAASADWSGLAGKPYVTVSPISGSEPNNGADYGPDTAGTTTLGIQEAINAVFAAGGGIVYLIPGVYNISAAPFQTVSSTETAQLLIPANAFGNPDIDIAIVSGLPGSAREFNVSQVPTGGALIYSTASKTYNDWVMAAGSTSNPRSDVYVHLDGIGVYTSGTATLSGVSLAYADKWHIGTMFIFTNENAPTTQYNGGYAFAPFISGVASAYGGYIDALSIQGYAVAIKGELSHCRINQLYFESCGVGLSVSSYYSCSIGHLEIQHVNTLFQSLEGPSPYTSANANHIRIDAMDIGDTTGAVVIDYTNAATYTVIDIGFLYNWAAVAITLTNVTAALGMVWIHNQQNTPVYATPALPGGTGSGNEVLNNTPYLQRVFITGQAGTHIVTKSGDVTISDNPTHIQLLPGESVYFATTVPTAWTWMPLVIQ